MSNRIGEAFDGVRASEQLKADTMSFLRERVYSRTEPKRRAHRLIPALACFALALLCAAGAYSFFTPVSAVSIDAESSVELSLNRYDIVVGVTAYDGAELAGGVKYRRCAAAIDAIIGGGCVGGGEVYITLSSAGDKELIADIADAGAGEVAVAEDGGEAARIAGMSLGKYRAFIELREVKPNVTEEDVTGLTVRQIRQLAESLRDVDSDSGAAAGQGNGGAGNGHGAGNGKGQGNGKRGR